MLHVVLGSPYLIILGNIFVLLWIIYLLVLMYSSSLAYGLIFVETILQWLLSMGAYEHIFWILNVWMWLLLDFSRLLYIIILLGVESRSEVIFSQNSECVPPLSCLLVLLWGIYSHANSWSFLGNLSFPPILQVCWISLCSQSSELSQSYIWMSVCISLCGTFYGLFNLKIQSLISAKLYWIKNLTISFFSFSLFSFWNSYFLDFESSGLVL